MIVSDFYHMDMRTEAKLTVDEEEDRIDETVPANSCPTGDSVVACDKISSTCMADGDSWSSGVSCAGEG